VSKYASPTADRDRVSALQTDRRSVYQQTGRRGKGEEEGGVWYRERENGNTEGRGIREVAGVTIISYICVKDKKTLNSISYKGYS
jgi:hypothetical protein